MSGFHYTEFSKTGSILLNAEEKDELFGYIDRLKAENDKLRELLWELFHCSRQVGCDCCETIYRRNCGVLDRIRELGIEVDA